jgi:hypothetical protein
VQSLSIGSGCSGADRFQGVVIAAQRLGCPVSADLTEQTMLDGIPSGGAGRIMRNGDAESQAIAQLPLRVFHLPQQPSYGIAAGCNPRPLELSRDLIRWFSWSTSAH